MAQHISVGHDRFALVDDEDLMLVGSKKWHMQAYGYPEHSSRVEGIRTNILMHRLILNAPSGYVVDHINGNRLDNRRANLRLCTKAENAMNRRGRIGATSGFKGVWRNGARWAAFCRVTNQRFYLGTFNTPEEAARAYDAAARQYHGPYARLNFADEV